MPRRRWPAAGRRAARRRQLRIPASTAVADVHAGGPAVARARDRRQHGDLQFDRHRAGQDAAGRRPAAIVLRRQLRREVWRQQRPTLSLLRAAPRSQPIPVRYRGVQRTAVQGVDRRSTGAGARSIRFWRVLRRARCSRHPRTHADARGRFRAGPRRFTRRGRRHQRRLLDAQLRKGSGSSREERAGRHTVGDDRRGHIAWILRTPGWDAARHHAANDARRGGSAIEAELVAERDWASCARCDGRAGARGARGAVGRLHDGSRDVSREARVLQRHRAGPRGQGRQRASSHLCRAADDRHGDRRRRAPDRLRQCGQPAARPRHREAARDGGAARDWRESRQAAPPAADRRRRAGVAGSGSRMAVRAVGRVVPGCGARRAG